LAHFLVLGYRLSCGVGTALVWQASSCGAGTGLVWLASFLGCFSRDSICLVFSLHYGDDLVFQEPRIFPCGIAWKRLDLAIFSAYTTRVVFWQEPIIFPEPLEGLDLQ
jgi:hypothetical protein